MTTGKRPTSAELRALFLKFFRERGHQIVLADQRVPPPLGHRLGSAGAVAEIVERTVPGLAAIDRTCREALPCAIDAERVA